MTRTGDQGIEYGSAKSPDFLRELRELAERLIAYPNYHVIQNPKTAAPWRRDSAHLYALAMMSQGLMLQTGLKLETTRVQVAEKSRQSINDQVTRLSRTTQGLDLHTDGSFKVDPDSLIMFGMDRPDINGGESTVLCVDDLVKELPHDILRILQQPIFPFGERIKPIISPSPADSGFEICFYGEQLKHSLSQGAALSSEGLRAVATLEQCLQETTYRQNIKLAAGESLIINNRKTLHGRTPLSDSSNRRMFRYRVKADMSGLKAFASGQIYGTALTLQLKKAARQLKKQKRYGQATELLKYLLSMHPNDYELANTLAETAIRAGYRSDAKQALDRSLASEPSQFRANFLLSALALEEGRSDESQRLLTQASVCGPLGKLSSSNPSKPKVIQIRSLEGAVHRIVKRSNSEYGLRLDRGQISTKYWLDQKFVRTQMLNATPDSLCSLAAPDCDILFNTVSDADVAPNTLTALTIWSENNSHIPIINRPESIFRCQRDQCHQYLNELSGIVMPVTRRYQWRNFTTDAALASQIAEDIDFPCIVRSTGSHTGKTVVLALSDEDLLTHLATLDRSRDVYATEFISAKTEQGIYQKIRCFVIDGEPYPVHNLRSLHWEVGRKGDREQVMAAEPWMVEDEAACLEDLEKYLGSCARQSFTRMAAALNLDFFGVDFTPLPSGELLVYEANPAMRHHYDHVIRAPHTRQALDRASDAFTNMLFQKLHNRTYDNPVLGSEFNSHRTFLKSLGVAELAHSGSSLLRHLESVAMVLKSWGCSETLQLAGLYHSVYGTSRFKTASTNSRDVIRHKIGIHAESLVFEFANLDRASLACSVDQLSENMLLLLAANSVTQGLDSERHAERNGERHEERKILLLRRDALPLQAVNALEEQIG